MLSKEANTRANHIIISCLVLGLMSVVCYETGLQKYKSKYDKKTQEYNELLQNYKTLEINYNDAIYDCKGGGAYAK